MSTFASLLEDFGTRLWRYHIKVPSDIATLYIKGKDRRIMCSLQGQEAIHTSIMFAGDEIYFININAEIRKTLQLKVGDELNVEIYKDRSKYGMKVCEEFAASLEMDPVAIDLFQKLTPGKKRNLIYLANQPKSSHIRLEKSQIILEFLKINNGKLDFKMLHLALKNH